MSALWMQRDTACMIRYLYDHVPFGPDCDIQAAGRAGAVFLLKPYPTP
jgi:hypothetical protein